MNQRPKPKDLAKGAAPSDRTLILKPSEAPTRALDARATLVMKDAEAQRMREATLAMPQQEPTTDEPTQGLPLQARTAEEPTVALQVPAAQTLRLPTGEPSKPAAESPEGPTLQVRQEDIAWMAGETPDPVEGALKDKAMADPTSRMKVSRSELSRIMKEKEVARTPPESRATLRLPPGAEAADTSKLSPGRIEGALEEPEMGTLPVPVVQAAEQTLILDSSDPAFDAALRPQAKAAAGWEGPPAADTLIVRPGAAVGKDEPTTALRIKPEAPAATTGVPQSEAPQGTLPIVKVPAEIPAPATTLMPQVEAPAATTLVLKPGDRDGTVAPQRTKPETPTTEMQTESATTPIDRPASAPAPATTLMPQVEAPAATTLVLKPGDRDGTVALRRTEPETPTTEMKTESATTPIDRPASAPAPATTLMPQVEAPAATTLVLKPGDRDGTVALRRTEPETPTTEMRTDSATTPIDKRASAPAPATTLMPQVEARPEPPVAAAPAPATMVMPPVGTKPEPPAAAAPAPATMVMPQVEARPAPAGPGPGGTVPVMRTGPAVPRPPARPAPEPPPDRPTGPGGTVQLMSPGAAEKPAPGHERPQPVQGSVPATGAHEPAPPADALRSGFPAPPPAAVEPPPGPPSPGTLLVPVEELSRLAEVPVESAPGPSPEAAAPPSQAAFSTRLMAQQQPEAVPPPMPATAWDGQPAAAAAPRVASVPEPSTGGSTWKVWTGLAVLALLAGAGAVLWLRPDLLGLGGGGVKRPAFAAGGDGPRREVPASLKAVKDRADAGDAGSMRYLGTCYANGLGVPRDVEEAKRWFRRAAEAGSQAAREELANLQRQER